MTDGDASPRRRCSRLPLRAGLLAAGVLACVALMLALLSLHVRDVRAHASRVRAQRQAVAAITLALRAPLAELTAGYAHVFEDPTREPAAVHPDGLFALLASVDGQALPAAVRVRCGGLCREVEQAVAVLQRCERWLQQRAQRARERHRAWRGVRTVVEELQRDVANGLQPGRAAPGDGQRLLALHAAATDIAMQAQRLGFEQEIERLDRWRERQLAPALARGRDQIESLAAGGATADVERWRDLLDGVRDGLLGGGGREGYVAAHRAWLTCGALGDELRRELAELLSDLRAARPTLERLLDVAIVRDQDVLHARLPGLWLWCVTAGVAGGLLLLLLVRVVTRGARAQMRELEEVHREAHDAVRAQSLFLANMSHEIRTPMNGVLGMAELLEGTPLDDEQRQCARTIRSSSEALLTIINDILDFSKIQAGKLELDASDFDLRNGVTDSLELLRHLASAKDVDLLCFIDHRVPRFVHADLTRLRQILLNLTGNAIKFTLDGSVTVLVELLSEHRELVRLAVSVNDTGIGIPAAAQERLFKTFSQAEVGTTRVFGGTGLGLTIAKRLVQMMGGDITVHSTPDVGTTFSFTLTLERAKQPEPVEEPADLSGCSVLVVAADDAEREALALLVAGWKMGFDAARDVERAVALLSEARRRGHEFDLVLVDEECAGSIAAAPDLAPARRVVLARPVAEERLRRCLQGALGLIPVGASTSTNAEDTDGPLQLHVLVAEDNEINQRVLQRMLDKIGCTARFVGDGRQALEQLAQEAFDLVLMDCQMPVLDGYEATRAIRALAPPLARIPVLALTANVMPSDRRACAEAGMDGFLSKPIKKQQLRAALQRWRSGVEQPAHSGDQI